MLNLSRRSLKATEDATKSTQRSTAALNKIAATLREMIRDDADATTTPPPLPKQGAKPTKTQQRKK